MKAGPRAASAGPLALAILAGSAAALAAQQRVQLALSILPDTVAVCRFPADAPVPVWASAPQPFVTVSRTRTELSVTAPEALVSGAGACEHGYRPVRVADTLPLDLVGVIAAMAEPLARNGISLFAVSTYETDYVLVRDADLARARRAWETAGHTVRNLGPSAPRPPEPEGSFVTVGGRRLWYRIEGTRGDPIVLIAGGPGAAHYFWPAFSVLADSFRVVYFDAFGRGRSDRARNAAEYSLAGDVEDLEGLRRALGLGPIVVYGHSYGGVVAQAYALRYPSSVKKVILANTFHSTEAWQNGNDDTWNFELRNQFPELWDSLMTLRSRGVLSCDSAYQDLEGHMPLSLVYYYDPTNAGHADYASGGMNLQVYCRIAGPDADVVLGNDLAAFDFRTRLAEIRAPMLVLAGRFDRVAIPRFTVQYRRYAPQAAFAMFERSGHQPFLEEPERHFRVVREFLAHGP